MSDMASANFNGLAAIYGEDVLDLVKGCEFHFKLSVERKRKEFTGDKERFKSLGYDLLYASTPEAYENALKSLKEFLGKQETDCVAWWDNRKRFIFRAFTRINAPQSNLAEVTHAGWKHRDKTGVSMLKCCYFDIRDRDIPVYIYIFLP